MQAAKKIVFFVFILCMLSGCVTLKPPQRGVMNGTVVYSSRPAVDVSVSPEIRFAGSKKDHKLVKSEDAVSLLDLNTELFLFVNAEQKKVRRAVTVTIKTISSAFVSDIYRNEKNVLTKGTEQHLGRNYQYIIKLGLASSREPAVQYALNEGYLFPSCYLMKAIGRIYNVERDVMIDIRYIEAVDEELFTCASGSTMDQLTNAQLEHLNFFSETSMESFRVTRTQ